MDKGQQYLCGTVRIILHALCVWKRPSMAKWSKCSHFINVSYDMVYIRTYVRILCALVWEWMYDYCCPVWRVGPYCPKNTALNNASSKQSIEICRHIPRCTKPILLISLIYCLWVPLTYSLMYNPATLLHTGHPLLYNIVLVEYWYVALTQGWFVSWMYIHFEWYAELPYNY